MPSFGAKLKQQREQRGITLEEISQNTKIGSRFLRALEEDRFDQLPGGIFNKGFIRAYARSVGADEEEAIAGYLEATGVSLHKTEPADSVPELRAEAERQGAAGLPWGALAMLLLIVALALAVWGFYSREIGMRGESSPALSQGGKPSRSETGAVPAAVGGSPSNGNVSVALRKNIFATPPAASDRQLTGKAPSIAPLPINLQIKVREDSWMSVAADGKQIMRGTMAAATQQSVHAAREIVVKAGNAGAVDFEFNGTKLPVQGNPGEVKTLIFDTAGLHPAPAAPTTLPEQGGSLSPR